MGDGVGDGTAVGLGPGPPIPPCLGRRLIPANATTTTATAAIASFRAVFMVGTLRAGHQARR